MIHYPRDKTAKLVIRFEVRSFFKPRLFPEIRPPRYRPLAVGVVLTSRFDIRHLGAQLPRGPQRAKFLYEILES